MSRTRSPAPTTGGRANPRIFHVQRFTDHAGGHGRRIHLSAPDTPVPSNFSDKPQFCFQIYSTVPLDLDEDMSPADPNMAKLMNRVIDPGTVSDNAQYPPPTLDIYDSVFPDVLACVEHQRLEIQHRKRRHQEPNALLIPKLTRALWDSRKRGFLIVVTSDSFRTTEESSFRDNGFGHNGPRWVWFDRHLPVASRVHLDSRYDEDTETRRKMSSLDPDFENAPVPPEMTEIACEVHQEQPESMQRALARMYSTSCLEQNQSTMDLGLEDDESGQGFSEETISRLLQDSNPMGYNINDIDGGVSVTTNISTATESTLTYIIYVQFCPEDNLALLRLVAGKFTAALCNRLSTDVTVSLQFFTSPTLSSIYSSFRQLQADHRAPEIGVLTSSTALANNTSIDGTTLPKRLYPISKREALAFNIPETSRHEPYRTFIVVLDRPDFAISPGVLFLLADGGQRKPSTDLPASHSIGANFMELQVLRSAGIDEVAKRLSMDYPEFV